VLHDSFFAHQGWDPSAVTLQRLLVQNNVTGCTVLINRALADKALEAGDPKQMIMHDWFLALTAAACGHVVFIPRPLVRYRQHGTNVKGASRTGLVQRGFRALSVPRRGHARIRLTYDQCRRMLNAPTQWPKAARAVMERYLATERMGKLRRVLAVRRGGYTMQSRVTRLGQIFFG